VFKELNVLLVRSKVILLPVVPPVGPVLDGGIVAGSVSFVQLLSIAGVISIIVPPTTIFWIRSLLVILFRIVLNRNNQEKDLFMTEEEV
jgi:hypothetical protein